MINVKRINIQIANQRLIIEIEKNLVNIQGLFHSFKNNQNPKLTGTKLKIAIRSSSRRSIKLSRNKNILKITGDNIDNLYNPFNLIGILQATFRFVGFHSIKNNFFLLHGSATLFNNKAICFADDGSSTAKTLGSIIGSLKSKRYIGDEFCFLDTKCKIFSYSCIPLHIRNRVYKYLKQNHKNISKIILNNEYKTQAGFFIDPQKLFRINKPKKLSAFVFVHFIRNKKTHYKKLNIQEKKKVIINCISAHLVKFIYPQLDRMQFITETDSTKKTPCVKQKINLVKKELELNDHIKYVIKTIPCYQFYIQNPNDILKLLGRIKF